MGHGLPEAVIMGRLRTAVQTLSDLELPPDEILGHLNDLVSELGDDCFATCLYAIYDPITRHLHHTPGPATRRPPSSTRTARCSFPHGATDPPLGRGRAAVRDRELPVPEESLLSCTPTA